MKKTYIMICIALLTILNVSGLEYYYDVPSPSVYPEIEEYPVAAYGEDTVSEDYRSRTYNAEDIFYGQPVRVQRGPTRLGALDYRGVDHIPTYWTRFSQVIGPLHYGNLPIPERFRLYQETEGYPYYEYRQNFAQYGSDYYPPFFQTAAREAERESLPESKRIIEPIGGHFIRETGRLVHATEMSCLETGNERRVFTGTVISLKVRDVLSSEGDKDILGAVCPTASSIRKEIACIVAPNTFVRLTCTRDQTGKRGISLEPMQFTELSIWARSKLMQNFHTSELYPGYA
ncbi:hypothetical protein J4410_06525 [Candidatus Woesearchaeota archaeon]|nr:hypothetical protein [Candidatus Woesearchaeota archaeon]